MKRYLLSWLILITVVTASAQEISITDSVIYFDKAPVAFYTKQINPSNPHYNVYIKNLDKKLLLSAEVAEFVAPVPELKSFFYYTLIFHNEKDTFAIYHEGQAFTLELATILKRYKLIDGNKINKDSLASFRVQYNGIALMMTKIKEYEIYLNESRFFNEQVMRDRTKPVTIVNDKIIMQDGKKIGLIVINRDNDADFTFINVKNSGTTMGNRINYDDIGLVSYKNIQVLLRSQRMVDATKLVIEPLDKRNRHDASHPLYESSVQFNKAYHNEAILWAVCQLVENYLL